MLQLCTVHKTCLLLETATRLQSHSQPPLRGFPFGVTLSQAISQLLAAKHAGNLKLVYLKSLSHYLNRFASGRELRLLGSFSTTEVEDWLKQFPEPSSRQTWLNRISTLFSFSVRRGWIEKNPCNNIERVRVDKKPPSILTPSQSRDLLASCPAICKPYLTLAMFAGVRPDEIRRLDWSQVNLETKTVSVDGKTRQRRIVPLPDLAVTHLVKHPLRCGPVAPSLMTIRRWRRKARAILGGKWTADILRHTAASYLLAKHQDAGKVALWLGNSPKILLSHYHEPVTAADCAAFWQPHDAAAKVTRGSANVENGVAGSKNTKTTL